MRKRQGRPPTPEEDRQAHRIHANLTEAELRSVEAAAEREKRKLADWVRQTVVDAAQK